MKTITLLILFLIPLAGSGQVINDMLLTYSENYSNLFITTQSKLQLNVIKEYNLGEVDTSYYMSINLFNKDIETTSYNISYNYTLGLSLGSTKEITKNESGVKLYKDDFIEFCACLNNAFKYIEFTKIKNTMVACNVGSFIFGSEKNDKKKVYYFSKNNTMLKMNRTEFFEMVQIFGAAKKYFK